MRANSLNLLRTAARCSRARPITPCGAQYGIRWQSSGEHASTSEKSQWSTSLAKDLADTISATGPVSVASYMRQCLISPEKGYYTRQNAGHDQFGVKGDFVTSPEISQVFGELVGIWLYTEWLAQGQKDKIQIIEVGPGRGTLMDDVLRTISTFKSFAKSIDAVYLVEASPYLQEHQAKLLSSTGKLNALETGNPIQFTSPSKHIPGSEIKWCEDIKFLSYEETSTPFIIAHEFFDALPIHVFQNTASSSIPASSTILTPTGPIKPKSGPQTPKNQWHEFVVSPIQPPDPEDVTSSKTEDKEREEFHLTVSKSPTPHSLYLPQTSPRYKALESTPNAIIEISPESLTYASDFATRIGGSNPTSTSTPSTSPSAFPSTSSKSTPKSSTTPYKKPTPSGCALILDYGPLHTIPTNTLRGIRSHRPCSPFTSPGLVDLSADVDFVALAESALNASPGVEVHGPVEQDYFLSSLGIKERAERLVSRAGDEETRKRLEGGWKRLVDRGPTGMGRIYKAMAIVPYVGRSGEVRRPVGFGGRVVG